MRVLTIFFFVFLFITKIFIKKNCNFEITDSEIFYFIIIFQIFININITKKLIVMPFL